MGMDQSSTEWIGRRACRAFCDRRDPSPGSVSSLTLSFAEGRGLTLLCSELPEMSAGLRLALCIGTITPAMASAVDHRVPDGPIAVGPDHDGSRDLEPGRGPFKPDIAVDRAAAGQPGARRRFLDDLTVRAVFRDGRIAALGQQDLAGRDLA